MSENGKTYTAAVVSQTPFRWIPVTERLPEKGQWVIIGGVKLNKSTVVCEATVSGLSLSIPWRAWAETRGKYFQVLASHWMPLPDHPDAALSRAIDKAEDRTLNERGSLVQDSPDGEAPQADKA